jgi:hypothetical protein
MMKMRREVPEALEEMDFWDEVDFRKEITLSTKLKRHNR